MQIASIALARPDRSLRTMAAALEGVMPPFTDSFFESRLPSVLAFVAGSATQLPDDVLRLTSPNDGEISLLLAWLNNALHQFLCSPCTREAHATALDILIDAAFLEKCRRKDHRHN